ncbi:RDD family protein [Helicobacter sp. MIT 14-3879]|uniref:RDD family protein n=1 Tax=Helicobacter sp. MIT 14-3879 TaxID=2040649 RepID=UPI000E1F0754|nr:RDD family protein [Helicobacter sp. MIT 14-3879]RDU63968.1 RDD family protein [Helicobacter sp. MIT 14-3879]
MKKILVKMLLLERIKAFITDIFMIYMPILYIAYIILGSKKAFLDSEITHFVCFLLYALITSILFSKTSQTLGYKYSQIILVENNKTIEESKISFLKAFIRFLLFCISMTLVFGVVLPFIRKDRRFFHDILCNTEVISESHI